MTVKELIDRLKDFPQEMKIGLIFEYYEDRESSVPIRELREVGGVLGVKNIEYKEAGKKPNVSSIVLLDHDLDSYSWNEV